MKAISSIFFCLLLACQATPSRQPDSYIENFANVRHLQNSTVSVLRKNAITNTIEGPVCSAFFVSRHLLATAYHCLDLVQVHTIELSSGVSTEITVTVNEEAVGSEIIIVTRSQYENYIASNQTRMTYYRATVVAVSEEHDLALVSTEGKYSSDDWLTISEDNVLAGETVYGMGMPGGLPWILTRGFVSTISLIGQKNIFHQAPVSPGASGGPLLNRNGAVIGVNVGFMERANLVSVAVPARYLQDLIDRYQE